jgi:hypothetical protein
MNVVLVLAKAIVYVVMSAYARPQELLSSRQQTLFHAIRATTKPCSPLLAKRQRRAGNWKR